MELRAVAEDHVTHVALVGRLGTEEAISVEVKFLALVCGGRRPAMIDLSRVDFIGSYGIRIVLSAAKTLAGTGSPLVLYGPTPQVRNVLHQSGVDYVVPILLDAEKARGLLLTSIAGVGAHRMDGAASS